MWSDIWTPARPLQSCESTSPRSLCFSPGEAQPSTPIFRAMSPLNLPPSHQASTQDRNIPGMLSVVLGKCMGVALYKCCLFVIAWLFFFFFFTYPNTHELSACLHSHFTENLFNENSLLGCLSLLRCGHNTVILVLLCLFMNCKYGVFVENVCRGVI